MWARKQSYFDFLLLVSCEKNVNTRGILNIEIAQDF